MFGLFFQGITVLETSTADARIEVHAPVRAFRSGCQLFKAHELQSGFPTASEASVTAMCKALWYGYAEVAGCL